MMIKRKNKNYFDVEKEMQFLNEQLNQGYLLTSTSIHAYEFEETSLKGQYYIAYITDEKQKQELDEMADEITEIKNEDFHSVCRMVKQLKNSFYRTDQLKGILFPITLIIVLKVISKENMRCISSCLN